MGVTETGVIGIAKELISIPSLSGEEGEIAYAIKDLLAEEGVDEVFIDKYGNVIGVIKGSTKPVIYEGHMDHVPPGDIRPWKYDPYGPTLSNGRLYGRGSVDMKGSIAAMIASIELINRYKDLSIYYIFVPYEEISEGTLFKYALESTLGVEPQLVVLGEATKLNIHIGHRGRAVVEVIVKGIPAHAAMPWEGINALYASARYIELIASAENSMPSHEILGRPTITPTIIECSPRSPPMIPDTCTLIIDYRLIVGENKDGIICRLEKYLRILKEKGIVKNYTISIPSGEAVMWTGARIQFEHYYPVWINNSSESLAVMENIRKTVNPHAKISIWKFSTDGVYSAGIAGYNTIGFGPGDERLAHKPNEYVEVKELVKAVEGYKTIADFINKNT